jgi:hypothetical protein
MSNAPVNSDCYVIPLFLSISPSDFQFFQSVTKHKDVKENKLVSKESLVLCKDVINNLNYIIL